MNKFLINLIELVSEIFDKILMLIEFVITIFLSYPFNFFAVMYVYYKLKKAKKEKIYLDLGDFKKLSLLESAKIEYLRIHLSCVFWLSVLAYLLIFK